MFAEELFFSAWILLPLVFGFGARLWLPQHWWNRALVIQIILTLLLVGWKYAVPLQDILSFPVWTGVLDYSTILLCWILYGYTTGTSSRFDGKGSPFLFGMLCGGWASALRYQGDAIALGFAFSGSCIGRMGLPLFLLFSPDIIILPLAAILGGIFGWYYIKSRNTEEIETSYGYSAWIFAGIIWCLAWWSPLIACVLGVIIFTSLRYSTDQERLPVAPLLYWLSAVLLISCAAGTGLLENIALYMEGGNVGAPTTMREDMYVVCFGLGLLSNPITSALGIQALLDRSLDVASSELSISMSLAGIAGSFWFFFLLGKGWSPSKKWAFCFCMICALYSYNIGVL